MAAIPQAPFWNGHPQTRAVGDTMIRGELEAIPIPAKPPTVEDAVRAMYEDGFVVFPNALTAEQVQTWRARIDAMGSQNDADYEVPNWCYNKQIGSNFHENPDYLEIADLPGIYETADTILSSKDGGPMKILFGSSWVTGPGRAMGLHVDYLPLQLPESVHRDPSVRVPIFMATVQLYLDDLVPEFGPTAFIPGSHRAGRPPQDETEWNGRKPLVGMLRAGDACLFRSDCWHGALMNSHPSKRRYIMQVAYGSGRMESYLPNMKWESLWRPEVTERMSPRQRALFGG